MAKESIMTTGQDDANSFEYFYREHGEALYNYLRKLTGQEEDAEDLLQETLVKIAAHLSDLEDSSRTRSWAFSIATNTAVDFFRRRGGKDIVLFDERIHGGGAASGDIEDRVIVDEMNECIRGEMGRIAPHYHIVLVLHYFEHMSVEEIAGVCGISISAVKVRLHRGRLLLNSILTRGCNFYYDRDSNIRCTRKPGSR
ncbi:MAG: RNA polymerase sigma factor [Spirochaetes bacterium]|nr:MAG: RNA polymerase sigma factor [Spirochaetota bacterium]